MWRLREFREQLRKLKFFVQRIIEYIKIKLNISHMNGRKLDFLIIGVQKGGTTSLQKYLQKNSLIGMSEIKELHFFDKDKFLNKGDYASYHSYFFNRKSPVLAEATPIYSFLTRCHKLIKDYNPDIKLILVLRDPVKRAYSQYNMALQKGKESLSFSEAVRAEMAQEPFPNQERIKSYVSRGFYFQQISKLLEVFESKQLIVLFSDDLMNNHRMVLSELNDFLGIPTFDYGDSLVAHKRIYQDKMDSKTESLLYSLYKQDIEQLERLMRKDLSSWKKYDLKG
ncbi:MAG: sulfotransferase domain-containing protein [Thiotrichales bacterium]|nr:sulfotransferase domain-containing protein [Thiotrichales bacterium]